MGAIETRSGRIGATERGGGAAIPIVFLHGVGSDKSVWHPQLEHFGRVRRAVALDYPGYGESEPIAEGDHDDLAAAMLAGMDALGIERAHVCGLSLGGVVAIALHTAAPQRCASLILADTFASHPDGRGIYERSTSASRSIGMRALAEARVDALLGGEAPAEVRAEVVETMAAIDPDAYCIGARSVWLADQSERAATIRVPTLVLCGTEDGITPPALSEDLASRIPDARLVLIEGAGHLANLEQPARFNSAIDRFLDVIDQEFA